MKDRCLSKFALGKEDGQSPICRILKIVLVVVICEINLPGIQGFLMFLPIQPTYLLLLAPQIKDPNQTKRDIITNMMRKWRQP